MVVEQNTKHEKKDLNSKLKQKKKKQISDEHVKRQKQTNK
jgi:hypothetical protein